MTIFERASRQLKDIGESRTQVWEVKGSTRGQAAESAGAQPTRGHRLDNEKLLLFLYVDAM